MDFHIKKINKAATNIPLLSLWVLYLLYNIDKYFTYAIFRGSQTWVLMLTTVILRSSGIFFEGNSSGIFDESGVRHSLQFSLGYRLFIYITYTG